ncbi:MAG: glycoside hydrolase family 57 protein [Candidatus Kapabacteria bacterium]|nr:glycoside hydrolase family 57 protein [Candidatus Kapabacteria bacterium]MDW8012636.1 glycoside hydrolase family 57 protein [Bacteroidota bacterium]
MLPLRVVFLWHYHQPDYRWQGRALLPWVRLRAVKDYLPLFRFFAELADFRCVFNVVPSLLQQLVDYAAGHPLDTMEELSLWASAGGPEQQRQPYWKMVEPPRPLLRRFPELEAIWQRWQAGELLEEQEWRDLQMWLQLVWMAPHRSAMPVVDEWFRRARGFRGDDLCMLVRLQRALAGEALSALRWAIGNGGIELSCSPFYHPVLPLVCDTDAARESDPELPLPHPPFRFPADTWMHCVRARQLCWMLLGRVPEGMWPPEGALSTEALHWMAASGVRWTATDEVQLFRSLPSAPTLQKYLPHRILTPAGPLVVFFRDRELSDVISFRYWEWGPERAVEDLFRHLWDIRSELLRTYGEGIMRVASVMIAVDGENCWDSYPDDGVSFLRALVERFRTEPWVTTATCQDVLKEAEEGELPKLPRFHTGSWVEGSLRIWIGTEQHNEAWELLRTAREELEATRHRLPPEVWKRAYEHLLVAEGSDWFWWLSPEHPTPAAPVFRELFRRHVAAALDYTRGL